MLSFFSDIVFPAHPHKIHLGFHILTTFRDREPRGFYHGVHLLYSTQGVRRGQGGEGSEGLGVTVKTACAKQ